MPLAARAEPLAACLRTGVRGRLRACVTKGGGDSERAKSGGQATVEFALVILILVVLIIAIIDFGRMVAMHVAAVAASREGARYGAAVGIAPGTGSPGTPRYLHCDGIRNQAKATTAALIPLTNADIDIWHDDGPGTALRVACEPPDTPVAPLATSITSLDRVIVTVTFTYQPITPLLQSFFGPITVVSTDRRTIVLQPPP
jgi:hypothetical protein